MYGQVSTAVFLLGVWWCAVRGGSEEEGGTSWGGELGGVWESVVARRHRVGA